MLGDQQDVWDQLKSLWDDPTSTVRDHLNVVSADFVDSSRFWEPIVNMNVEPVPPDRPKVTGLTFGPGQVSVAFSAPADQGTGPITSYTVTGAISGQPTSIGVTGTSSPITVTGLENHQVYTMALTATNAAGTSRQWPFHVNTPDAPPATATNAAGTSQRFPLHGATPGHAPTIHHGPAHKGFVGVPYHSSFAVSAMQGSRVTLASGWIPPGLTLQDDGTLSGTPTRAGEYKFGVRATNQFGYHRGVATVVISEIGAPHPETGWQEMRAKVCTKGAKGRRECATRLLFGPFPRLEDRAAVSLVDGVTTFATGHVTRDGKLILRGRCEPPLENHTGLMESEPQCEVPFGRYTLVLHRSDHHSIFVPVTLH